MTHRYTAALEYASELHFEQTKKGGSIPYIAHLIGVSSAVFEMLGSEDEAIAGLLHDSAEDVGAEVLPVIEQKFGSRVREIVEHCSDSMDPSDKGDWHTRKTRYIRRLRAAANDDRTDPGYLRVVLADKLYNARSISADLVNDGDDSVFDLFRAAGKTHDERRSNSLAYYSDIERIYTEAKHLPGGCGWHVQELTRAVQSIGGGNAEQTLLG
jgi:(p)ppGpp synthase/HD superfamily hydrolase